MIFLQLSTNNKVVRGAEKNHLRYLQFLVLGTSSPGVLHLTGAVEFAVSDDELDNVSLDEINDDGDVLSSASPKT